MPAVANHNLQHELEVELWIKELAFLNDQINIMKRNLPGAADQSNSEECLSMIGHFSDSFSIQKKWLHRMKLNLENISRQDRDEWENEFELSPSMKMFSLQMQANRIVNDELKDNFLKFLVKWM